MSLEQSVNQDSISEEEQIMEEARAEAEAMRNAVEPEVVNDQPEVEGEQVVENQTESETDNEPVEKPNTEVSEPEVEPDVRSMEFKEPIKITDRGLDLPVKNMQELIQLAQQGLNFTRKTQELSSYKKLVETVKSAGVDESDIQMLADIKAGNKTAINGLAEKYKLDLYDIDNEATYKPEVQLPTYNEADYVAEEIMRDERLATEFKDIVQYVPDSFKNQLATDARVLKAFSEDVRSGIARQVLPETVKRMAMNPNGDFIGTYLSVVDSLSVQPEQPQQQLAPEVVQQVATKPTVANATSSAKAKVSISSGSQSQARADDSLDIWENGLSDSELIRRIQIQADRLKNG